MLDNVRNFIEQNIIFQFIATFLCSIQSTIMNIIRRASNNKWIVGIVVIILGSVYPLILKYTKNGQSKYPFMIGVAICVKNLFMLIYYFASYITFLCNNQSHNKVYNYQHIDSENNSPSSFHASHHNFLNDNTSHQLSPHLHRHHIHRNRNYININTSNDTTHKTSQAMMNLLTTTPSKIARALSILKSQNKSENIQNKNTSYLHKLAKEESEITSLANHSESMQSIEMEHTCSDNNNNIKTFEFPSLERIKHRLKLYCYLA
eukprot:74483_1